MRDLDEPIRITPIGAATLGYYDDWDELCEKEGRRDPYEIIESNKKKKYTYTQGVVEVGPFKGCRCTHVSINNDIDEFEGTSREERDKYIKDRDLFIAQCILRDFGLDGLMKSPFREFASSLPPCDYNGQCSFFCCRWKECKG